MTLAATQTTEMPMIR